VTVPKVTLKVASLEETVTVTSQAPLVDVSRAQVAGNIDRRQMAELPLQGRNWQELALMVESGLPPLAALQTATLNPARFFGLTDSLGTVEVGKVGDLVVLVAGSPPGTPGRTNALRVHRIGDAIDS
jgi:imidazolonepropionase-like amidohydrolase